MLYQMAQSKNKNGYHNYQQTLQNKESLIVVYNLNSKRDISSAVDALLLNDELSNSSSIFAIVPASDDEDENLSGGFNSTIAIQLSENYTNWMINSKPESDAQLKEQVSCNLKPSNQDSEVFKLIVNAADQFNSFIHKKLSNKLCQITTPHIVTNKLCQMTTPCEVTNKLCQVTTPHEDVQKQYHTQTPPEVRHRIIRDRRDTRNETHQKVINKLCQVGIPAEVIYRHGFGAATDTTIDRPCCCKFLNVDVVMKKSSSCCCVNTHFTQSIQNSSNGIVPTRSQLISPVLVKTDFSAEEYESSSQSSFLEPGNKHLTSISAGLISPKPDDYDQIFDFNRLCNTPQESESDEKQELILQSCQCTPEKLRRMLEQVLAEKSLNKRSVCCSPMDTFRVPKRTRFLDVKCSPCLREKHKSNTNNCALNPSSDCHCENLLDVAGQTLQNVTASTLFCFGDRVNVGVQGAASSTHGILKGPPRHADSNAQAIWVPRKEGHLKARGTYTQSEKPRRYSAVVATGPDYKHIGTAVATKHNFGHPPLHSGAHKDTTSISSNKGKVTSNLIRAMSGLKYPLNQEPSKPKSSDATKIVKGKINSGSPPLKKAPHNDCVDLLNSITSNEVISTLIRTLSGYRYPEKPLSLLQKPNSKMTFEDFLKYYANMNITLKRPLPDSCIKILPNPLIKPSNTTPSNKSYKKKIHPIPPLPPPEKLKGRNVRDPVQGLKLCMSGKVSEIE